MATTDTSEKALESLIVKSLVEEAGYAQGVSADYDKDHAVDLPKLAEFIKITQPDISDDLSLNTDGPGRQKFLARLQGEIAKRGVIDVLRKGIKHGPYSLDLFYGTPTPGNETAKELYAKNIFSVTRQLHFSKDETQLSLDFAIFINGLPIATSELKNKLTKQTAADAVKQYKQDRDPKELLFQFGRCVVHFALDEYVIMMCTHLKGKASWFLPFNKGVDGGAGNPVNPNGIATDYLWKEVLTKPSLTNILENYAQIVTEKDEKSGKKRRKQIFPRYHQLDVVRRLLATAKEDGPGNKYLIQHSAGSGKSNSITWLAHQLVELKKSGKPIFDSIIVVTDRRLLDKQIRDNIRHFAQVSAVVGAVTQGSGQLKSFIHQGKKIIISTVQKFPNIVAEIGNEHRDRTFAILIDEAHSSQGGRTAAALNVALSQEEEGEEETVEDKINRVMEAQKMLSNASYFAFTATPKNKTLELFGKGQIVNDKKSFSPFHSYTMMQAIQEGFILDVLANYTPVDSYYRLIKMIEDDPEFDTKRAQKKLRRYVESHDHAIRKKAEIMVDHFHDKVIAYNKIGGQARAMVVTSGIKRAIQYFYAFQDYLKERKSQYRAIVAFSGEHEYGGAKVTEAKLNNFPSVKIADYIREEPYRFLIVADKFQTGYDEPLLHTMYVDKHLAGVKAVQTLSRLNRARPTKMDTFVLDFMNSNEVIQKAFEPYYKTTILSGETDPNKLHDLKADLEGYQVYSQADVDLLVELYLSAVDRDKLDPILQGCVATYKSDLDENGQVEFKGKAKTFIRTYNFLSTILSYTNIDWHKLSIFLYFLVPSLPAPKDEDLSKGILETIDMDSYRVEVKAQIKLALPNDDGTVDPVAIGGGGGKPEQELDYLSNIIKAFNDQFGNVDWKDPDKINKVITEEIPTKVAADEAYKNACKNADKNTARIEHDQALLRVMTNLLADHTDLYKMFSDDQNFKKWLADTVFGITYKEGHQDR